LVDLRIVKPGHQDWDAPNHRGRLEYKAGLSQGGLRPKTLERRGDEKIEKKTAKVTYCGKEENTGSVGAKGGNCWRGGGARLISWGGGLGVRGI